MTGEIAIRIDGRAGRITLQRPDALNALTWDMCRRIAAALAEWRDDEAVSLIMLEGDGDRAFCAGGDIADMYRHGSAGDFAYGQRFWRDEYRMNAALGEWPKPVVSFLQGFTMGGGVGIGCHGSHRIVGAESRIAMPECGIGLIPDVGGSCLLACAPGHAGECLAATGRMMDPGDAVHAGFADVVIPESRWDALKGELCARGDPAILEAARISPPEGELVRNRAEIERIFSAPSLTSIFAALEGEEGAFLADCRKRMGRNSPLSMASAIALIRRQRPDPDLRRALSREYRFVYRSLEHSDFLEGIRARIIDKDNRPAWKHSSPHRVADSEIEFLLGPLGDNELTWETPQ